MDSMIFPETDLSDYCLQLQKPNLIIIIKVISMQIIMKRLMLAQWYFHIHIQNQKPLIY